LPQHAARSVSDHVSPSCGSLIIVEVGEKRNIAFPVHPDYNGRNSEIL